MIDITQPNMILMKDGVEVSRHRSAVEAMEKAAESGAGTYTLVRPDATIVVDGFTPDPVDPSPIDPDPVEPDPVDPDPPPDPVDPPAGEVDWNTPVTDLFGATYEGLCRIDNGSISQNIAAYGSFGTITITADQMWVPSKYTEGKVAEYNYPTFADVPLSVDAPIATRKSNWIDVVEGGWTKESITEMYDDGTQIWAMIDVPYDGIQSTQNIALISRTGVVDKYYATKDGPMSNGWIGKIPPEWQADFGGTHFMGSTNNFAIRYHSGGPSLYVFDGTPEGAATAVPKMNFPYSAANPRLLGSIGVQSPLGNPLYNQLSRAYAMFFWGDDIYVLGSTAALESEITYKVGRNGYNPTKDGQLQLDDYWSYYWKFKAQDILAAKNVWEPVPYDYGKLTLPVGQQGIITGQMRNYYFDDDTSTLYGVQTFDYPGASEYANPPTVFKWDWSSVPKARH